MKTKETIPVRVYRDELFEAKTRVDLENARLTLQSCLDIWNGLDLIPLKDICPLILNPQTVYGNAVNQLAEPPVTKGRFQVSKQAYIQTLDIPIPDSLYRICRDARKLQFATMSELWCIEGDQVVLNETAAEPIIYSKSIFCSPDKKELAKNILKYIELTNSLSEKLELPIGSPAGNTFFRSLFHITQKTYPGAYSLELIPDKLREWLQ